MTTDKEPEAFGYCWHRSNGQYYYGRHAGPIDDWYAGRGVRFMKEFGGEKKTKCKNPEEWHRTIEFRGTWEECCQWEIDTVTAEMVKNDDCLNINPGSGGKRHSEETKKQFSIDRKGKYTGKDSFNYGGNKGEKNPMFGRHHSEKTKALIQQGQKGKKSKRFGGYIYGVHVITGRILGPFEGKTQILKAGFDSRVYEMIQGKWSHVKGYIFWTQQKREFIDIPESIRAKKDNESAKIAKQQVIVDGVTYKTVAEASRTTGISKFLLNKRRGKPWSVS